MTMTREQAERERTVLAAPNGGRRKKLRLRDALRVRFKTADELLRALGMDAAMLPGPPEQRSQSIMDDQRTREFAMHGHGRDQDFDAMDDADRREWGRAFLADCGLSSDAIDEFFERAFPERAAEDEEGEPDERYRDRVLAQRGESGAERHSDGRGQEASRQRVLESSERRTSPNHSRENREAYSREHRNSRQNEDHQLPRNARNGGMGGRLAGDADEFAKDYPDAMKVGCDMAGSWKSDVARAPLSRAERRAALAMDETEVVGELVELFGEHFGRITIAP
jgi:hypothetical protein